MTSVHECTAPVETPGWKVIWEKRSDYLGVIAYHYRAVSDERPRMALRGEVAESTLANADCDFGAVLVDYWNAKRHEEVTAR